MIELGKFCSMKIKCQANLSYFSKPVKSLCKVSALSFVILPRKYAIKNAPLPFAGRGKGGQKSPLSRKNIIQQMSNFLTDA